MLPRFILAKYVPDLSRMEPRNIGIFVWRKGEVCAKFLEPTDAAFINELDTYDRWVAFWKRRIDDGNDIRPSRGKPVSKDDPACIDAIVTHQKGNYLLVDAGEVMHNIGKRELPVVADYLFSELVARKATAAAHPAVSFTQQCDAVMHAARVAYKSRIGVECMWNTVPLTLHPDYYVGNGEPDAIFQRAKLSHEASMTNAALVVDAILNTGVVPTNRCRFLIRGSEVNSPAAEQGVALCEKLCGVIDIETSTSATQVAQVAQVSQAALAN